MLRGMCRAGNVPIQVAHLMMVIVDSNGEKEVGRLRAWRTDKLVNEDSEDLREVANGLISSVQIARSRIERGLMRADVAVMLEGRKTALKLWLPRPRVLRKRWLRELARFGTRAVELETEGGSVDAESGDDEESDEGARCAEIDEARVAEVWKRLAADQTLPPGWHQLHDKVTGFDFYYDEAANVTTWMRPTGLRRASDDVASPLDARELAAAWLLQQVMDEEVEAMLSARVDEAPILSSLLADIKACPLLDRAKWTLAVEQIVSKLPSLVQLAESVQTGRARLFSNEDDQQSPADLARDLGSRFHLTQAAAQPLFFLSFSSIARGNSSSVTTDSLERRFFVALQAFVSDMRHKVLAGDPSGGLVACVSSNQGGLESLPIVVRNVVTTGLPLLTLRLCRALRPRSERLRRIKAAVHAFPHRSLVTALSIGAFPSSRSFIQGLIDLIFKTKVKNGETVAQRLARANVGLEDAEIKAQLDDLGPALRDIVMKADDDELEQLDEIVAARAGVALDDDLRSRLRRAAIIETYRRSAERLVASYGDPEYTSFISTFYCALLEPIAAILVDRTVNAANLINRLFKMLRRAVEAASAPHLYTDYDRLLMIDADVADLASALVGAVKRIVLTDIERWIAVAIWVRRILDSFSLALVLPDLDFLKEKEVEGVGVQQDLDTLMSRWNDDDQRLSSLGSIARADVPIISALIPRFKSGLISTWQVKRSDMLPT